VVHVSYGTRVIATRSCLWSRDNQLTRRCVTLHKSCLPHADIVNVIRRIKLLGFTAVRLPFSMQNLVNDTARDFQWTACQNVAQSDIIASVTNPAVGVPKGAQSLVAFSLAMPVAACAGHLRARALYADCSMSH